MQSTCFFVVLSAFPAPNEAAVLLLSHADEFITLPISPVELFARLTALHRRSAPRTSSTLECGPISAHTASKEVCLYETPIKLSRIEYLILELLLEHASSVVPREDIASKIWELPEATASNTIDVHIKNIRRKLKPEHHRRNGHGIGYRMN